MRTMSHDEIIVFLTTGTRTGKLATVRADGRPHVTPIWFVVDGDSLIFNTWHTSAKARHLRRDPRASLVVDLEEPPFGYVKVDGSVTITQDPSEVKRYATLIGGRYMGLDRAEEFGKRNGVEGELVVRLPMETVTAYADVAG